jgi:hypothetical protein
MPSRSPGSIFRSVVMRTLSFFSKSRMDAKGEPKSSLSDKSCQLLAVHITKLPSSKGNSGSSHSLSNFYRKLTIHDFELIKIIGKGSFGKVTVNAISSLSSRVIFYDR